MRCCTGSIKYTIKVQTVHVHNAAIVNNCFPRSGRTDRYILNTKKMFFYGLAVTAGRIKHIG